LKQLNDFEALPTVCAYCGASPAPTKDHVIPRGLQSKGGESWESFAVRACEACNNQKSKLDEEARNLLVLYHDLGGDQASQKLIHQEVKRSMHRLIDQGRSNATLRMLRQMEPVYVDQGEGNLTLAMAGKPDIDIFAPWLEYVVRGISVAWWGVLSQGALLEVKAIPPVNFDQFYAMSKPWDQEVQLGNHTLVAFRSAHSDPGIGAWAFRFYGGLGFGVLVWPSGTSMEEREGS
jgi:hypothetical protein